jgi:hypothetical protein
MDRLRGCEFVCGQRGCGKTTYIKRRILSVETRVLIYDHMAEFRGFQGYDTVDTLEACIDYVRDHPRGLCRVVYSTLKASPEEFALTCKIPFTPSGRGIVFVCDELDQFAGPNWPPDEFRNLVHFGRHAGSSFVGASRRPANVSRDFTSQAKRYVCFRITEPVDLRFLRSVVGDKVLECKDLPPLHYFAFEEGKILRGVVSPT